MRAKADFVFVPSICPVRIVGYCFWTLELMERGGKRDNITLGSDVTGESDDEVS